MLTVAVMALALWGGQEAAPPPQETPDVVADVEVRGVAGDPVRQFVDGLTLPGESGRYQGQIARWDVDLCVVVFGAVPEVDTYLTDQIAANFASLDVPHGRPGCQPTVTVLVSTEADALSARLTERYRHGLFRMRRASVGAFLGPPRPVRWQRLNSTDQRALPNSRLKMATTRTTQQAIIVVDAQRANAAPLDALAAYLAFVAIVDLPPDPPTGGRRTILSLFDPAATDGPRALTAWDRAFIGALYDLTPDVSFAFQKIEMAERMRKRLEPTP